MPPFHAFHVEELLVVTFTEAATEELRSHSQQYP
jgi:ATP-dependent exoDNAse (exonuclease V) beta subunit